MTWLEIRPQDVWLFRDGKPFSAGEDHSAHSMFPPTPLTVQGALRQKISVSLGVSLREYKAASVPSNGVTEEAREVVSYIGKHGELSAVGAFEMRGPFVSLRTDPAHVTPLFPVPADLFKHSKSHQFRISKPTTQKFVSDLNDEFQYLEVEKDYENLPGYWMSGEAFTNYLNGELPDSATFHSADEDDSEADEDEKSFTALDAYQKGKHIWHSRLIYQNDNRFGVSTNALTSFREEGQLYQVGFVRPLDGIGLLVHVTDAIPKTYLEGAVSIGGEHRQANAVTVESVTLPAKPQTLSGQFKVIFLTPAYFDDGWQPKNGDWSTLFGPSVTLQSAALYRPLKIGGWDSAAANGRGAPRAMHNYVAPGSVYYFSTTETFSAPEALTQKPSGINAKALGFGQYITGQW